MAINVLLLMTVYPHFSLPRDERKRAFSGAVIRIEHRIVPRRHARPKPRPVARPHPRAEPLPRVHPGARAAPLARPRTRVKPLPLPLGRPLAQAKPRSPAHPHRTAKPRLVPHRHARVKSRPLHRPARSEPSDAHGWSGHLTFTPKQSAALSLPASWATQDNGNAAASNMTVWMDFKKARGAFVPQVMLWHVNAAYLSGPSLHDAVHDIVESLRAQGAKVYVSKAQLVCSGKRLGWFLAYEKPTSDPPWQFEDTLYMSGDTVYRATYSRLDGQEEDKGTRAALNTLCPES